MKEIYIVTSGEYSSYGIDAVFSKMQDAINFAVANQGEVETYIVDNCIIKTKNDAIDYVKYVVFVNRNLTVTSIEKEEVFKSFPQGVIFNNHRNSWYVGVNSSDMYCSVCVPFENGKEPSEEKVLKIATDYMAEEKAKIGGIE